MARRNTYFAPHLIQNMMLANDDVRMNRMQVNNGVRVNNCTRMEGLASPLNVQQSHLLPHPSLNLPNNQLDIGACGSNHGARRQSSDHLNSSFNPSITPQLNQLQADTDLILSEHTKKMTLEIDLRFKRQMRQIVTYYREKANKKIKNFEAKIRELNQMNAVLHEKTVALSMENHSLRNLAKENEEIINSLRDNLVHMISQARITLEEVVPGSGVGAEDGCHSLCGSNIVGGSNEEGKQQEVEILPTAMAVAGGDMVVGSGVGARMRLSYGKTDSCALFLP